MHAKLTSCDLRSALREAVAIGQKGLHESFRTAYMTVNSMGNLRLLSFSPEAMYTAFLDAKDARPGVAATPIFPFYGLISKLPEQQEIVIDASDTMLTIRWRRNRYNLPLISGEFPEMKFPEQESGRHIGATALREALKKVSFVPEEEAKAPYQSCVLIRPYKDEKILLAATCGPLLCTSLLPGFWEEQTIFHMNTIKCLESILFGKRGDVEYYSARNEVTFFVGSRILMLRSAAMGYPDLGKAFPKGKHGVLRFRREELLGVLERASIYHNARIRLEVLPDKQVRLSAASEGGPHGGEEFITPVGDTVWFDVSVLVRSDSFLKLIQHQEGDDVEVVLHGTDQPLMIRGVDNSYLQLLAPMRF